MSSFNSLNDIGSAIAAGYAIVNNPGTGNELNLSGKSLWYCVLSAGTYKIPDVPRPGIEGIVYATGAVTLTNHDGSAVATLASGQATKLLAKTTTAWVPATGAALNTMITDAGAYTATTTVEAAIQELYSDDIVEVPITTFIQNNGAQLTTWLDNAASNPGFTLISSGPPAIRWNNNNNSTGIMSVVGIPPRALTNGVMTLHILASKVGATSADATTFDVSALVADTAALHDAGTSIGGTTSAMTGNATSKRVQHVTLAFTTLAESLSGPLPAAGPLSLGLVITPTQSKLNTDDLLMHRCYLTF